MKSLMLLAVALATPAFVWCACSDFHGHLRNNVPTGLDPCPCTASQAGNDSRFAFSNFSVGLYHPGANSCYRSAEPTSEESGQQCCYRSDGSIMVGPPGGGTADRYLPVPWWNLLRVWNHQVYDVHPWDACCKNQLDSANCRTYYRYRPSDDCSGYVPPTQSPR